jgi:hypothetical protein
VRYGLSDGGGIINEQGFEMGRLSYIFAEVVAEDGEVPEARIGGVCRNLRRLSWPN